MLQVMSVFLRTVQVPQERSLQEDICLLKGREPLYPVDALSIKLQCLINLRRDEADISVSFTRPVEIRMRFFFSPFSDSKMILSRSLVQREGQQI